MRDLPNHAKIQGIITACTYSRVCEGFLQMHKSEGSLATRTRFAELADPNVDHTLGVATPPAPLVRPCLPRSFWQVRFWAVLCRQHGTCGLCSLSI